MKPVFSKITLVLFLFSTLIISCTKTPVNLPKPTPGTGDPGSKPVGVQMAIQLPAGATVQPDSATLVFVAAGIEHQAKVKLEAANNQLLTGLIQLPAGNYQLTKMLVKGANGRIAFVVPRQQSEKATVVSRPLPITLASAANAAITSIEVAAVASTDQPSLFGYPNDAFNQESITQVVIRPTINVGGYVYDSVDAQLELTWYDAQQQAHMVHLNLAAGSNNVGLPKEATRYHFLLRKWNVTDEMELPVSAVSENMFIAIGGAVAARKLSEEYTWHEVEGTYRPYSKKEYKYNAAGKLIKTLFYQKVPQHADLVLQQVEEMEYLLGKVSVIHYFDGSNKSTGHLKFTYDNNGRVTHMEHLTYDRSTYAAVQYSAFGSKREVEINYLYDNRNAMEYKFIMEGGNKIREGGVSSTGGSEGASFTYDGNINPFHVIGYQDIYLRHISRNNRIAEDRKYVGNIPTNVAYNFSYSYDSKGYPTQLITSYKGYSSGTHLYNAKTQYTYNN